MKNITLLILLLIIPFMSCKSMSKHENSDPQEMSIGLNTGDIKKIELVGTILTIHGSQIINIAYTLPKETLNDLRNAETYSYSNLHRPDGPISEVVLKSGAVMISWIGNGIRENGGVKNLSVFSSGSTDSIILKSKEKEWIVPADTETVINWGDGDYIVYASRISLGKIEDQPPFRCNLILLKK